MRDIWMVRSVFSRKRKTRTFISIAACLLSCASTQTIKKSDIIGSYQTVSESEWSIVIDLRENGGARVEHTSWLAGQYDQRTTAVTRGTWRIENDLVLITFLEATETLTYSQELPLTILGIEGHRPGLEPSNATDGRVTGRQMLWRLPHDF